MKVRINIWTVLFGAGVVLFQTFAFTRFDRKIERLSDNFAALAAGTEYYRINDSISAARSERILLDNAEIKAYFPEIKNNIEQMMDVKLRQMERYSAVSSTANYEIATKIHQRETVEGQNDADLNPLTPLTPSPLYRFTEYKDRWIDFRQYIIADSAYTTIQTRDSIGIVQSWTRPHKFLFVNWGRKQHIQTVVNFNPYSKITYSIYVEKQ